jgi:hypothetical protein
VLIFLGPPPLLSHAHHHLLLPAIFLAVVLPGRAAPTCPLAKDPPRLRQIGPIRPSSTPAEIVPRPEDFRPWIVPRLEDFFRIVARTEDFRPRHLLGVHASASRASVSLHPLPLGRPLGCPVHSSNLGSAGCPPPSSASAEFELPGPTASRRVLSSGITLSRPRIGRDRLESAAGSPGSPESAADWPNLAADRCYRALSLSVDTPAVLCLLRFRFSL